jgi:hypothetical protein
MEHSGNDGDTLPDGVTFIIALRRAMMRPLPCQQRRSVAEPMLERSGVNFDRLIQRHIH